MDIVNRHNDPELLSESEEFEDDPFENDLCIRSKWQLDGCKTIDEIITRLDELKVYYEKLKNDGWELIGSIEDDWGFAQKK